MTDTLHNLGIDQEERTHPLPNIPDTAAGVKVLTAVVAKRADAEIQAWKNLARYKFFNFGYWVGKWVGYNQCLEGTEYHTGSPFKNLVHEARDQLKKLEEAST